MLERVPLAIRLTALIAVPLLVVVVSAAARVQDFRGDQAEAVSFSEQMDDVVAIDHAIRALQTERDLSLQLYTLPDGDRFEAELLAALEAARDRAQVAIADAGLSEALPLDDLTYQSEQASSRPRPADDAPAPGGGGTSGGGTGAGRSLTSGGRGTPSIPPFIPYTLTELRELGEVRTAAASRVEELYSGLIAEYQRELMAAAGIDGSVVPASYLVSYQNVLWGTEQFARLRVLGLLLLADDDPDPSDLRLLGQTNDQERFFLAQAEDIAQPEQQQVLRELLGAPAVVSFDEIRRAVLVEDGFNEAVTREVWLTRTHVRLAALTDGADAFLAELLTEVDSSVDVAQRQYMQTFATSVVVVLAVAFGAWVVTRSISDPLRRLAVAARNASVGRLTKVDAPPSRDAIGEIGRAYQELTLYMHTVSGAAEEIASGNLRREIQPRSPDDRLGTALHSMTRQLSSMVTRSQQRSRELAETVGELRETVARDALTGLVSRSRFEQLIDEGIREARPIGRAFGVLFIDLDGFKPVNDTLGHDAGDELLREVALRLVSAMREHDVVARLGGDEFTAMLNDPRDIDALRMTARRVVEMLQIPYSIAGQEVRISASVGLARYPDHGGSATELLRASDQAMYKAKHAGGSGAHVAEPEAAA
ncbi:MAG: diguanylate cyclase [Dehalococcoidia bacterium]|jgi:diguanylate cyclase (GGDEF)-like protein|nr:diguanylate cyclase [Dehalococcoidia bacterium]